MTFKEQVDELIQVGNGFTFQNNSVNSSGEHFSRASPDLLAWVARVEHFVVFNYGENSPLFRLYGSFKLSSLNGNYQSDFDKQLNVVKGVLKACADIPVVERNHHQLNQDFLSNLLDKFHDVVKLLRIRHSNRPTLDINDEYDVQDLLHALLKINFDDVRKEEWTPSYAGGSARMDFLLKAEKTVIEVKKTRLGLGDKELGKQLIEDKAKYKMHQDCKKLVCFVYDPGEWIINPRGIQSDLNSEAENFKVEIIIKP